MWACVGLNLFRHCRNSKNTFIKWHFTRTEGRIFSSSFWASSYRQYRALSPTRWSSGCLACGSARQSGHDERSRGSVDPWIRTLMDRIRILVQIWVKTVIYRFTSFDNIKKLVTNWWASYSELGTRDNYCGDMSMC